MSIKIFRPIYILPNFLIVCYFNKNILYRRFMDCLDSVAALPMAIADIFFALLKKYRFKFIWDFCRYPRKKYRAKCKRLRIVGRGQGGCSRRERGFMCWQIDRKNA